MTIQAYQTLYESSIAYGMRKALQAEQSKAEMLIKIQNIEDELQDLDDEVEELKRRISKMLIEEKQSKEKSAADHQNDVDTYINQNQKQSEELKKLLFTF